MLIRWKYLVLNIYVIFTQMLHENYVYFGTVVPFALTYYVI